MNSQNLARYIDDQITGSGTALELIRQLAERPEHASERPAFIQLHDRVEADRSLLSKLLELLNMKSVPVLEGIQVPRKQRPPVGELGIFEMLESLLVGLTGKKLLWMVLQEIAPHHPVLEGMDFRRMHEEAREQRELIERKRSEFGGAVAA